MTYRTRNIALAVALGIGAALLVTLYVKNSGTSSALGADAATVFVASHDIPAGTLGADLRGTIRAEQVLKRTVIPGAITSKDQVRGLVTTDRIYAGQQVTGRAFQPRRAEGVEGEITGTTRVLHVPGTANQLLVGTVKDGDRVDVLANLKYRLVNFRGAAGTLDSTQDLVATRIVLRNLLVLQAPEPPEGSGGIGGTSGWEIVLALTDNQSQKLFFVMQNGDWSLQLRPAHRAGDSPDSVETTGSVLSDGLKSRQFAELISGPRSRR